MIVLDALSTLILVGMVFHVLCSDDPDKKWQSPLHASVSVIVCLLALWPVFRMWGSF